MNVNQTDKESGEWSTFSIFISSTFKDMHQERDYLNRYVYNELREELEKFRVHLNILDLRWGIHTSEAENEEEREKKILKVCTDEIKRCNPFFIAILGERYGWQPDKTRIIDFIKELNQVDLPASETNKKSVTHLEIEYGILQHPQLLTGSVACFRKFRYRLKHPVIYLKYSDNKHKKYLLESLKKELQAHFARNNEILGTSDVIFEYDVEWNRKNKNFTGIEEWGQKIIKAIRSCRKYRELTQTTKSLSWLEEEERTFQQFIENHSRKFKYLDQEKVLDDELFTGRSDILAALLADIKAGLSERIIFVKGESGTGKSAILANLYIRLLKSEQIIVLGHSATISPRSSQLNLLMQKWIVRLLKNKSLPDEQEINLLNEIENQQFDFENDYEEFSFLKRKLNELIHFFSPGRVVLIIDAVDYLEQSNRVDYFSWIENDLPENVRIICSMESTERFKLNIFHHDIFFKTYDIKGLQEKETIDLVRKLGFLNNKNLRTSTVDKIVRKSLHNGFSNPLWINMSLAFLLSLDSDDFKTIEKKRSKGSTAEEILYSYIDKMVDTFDHDCGKLFLQLLEKAKPIFGGNFVSDVFNYLSISRFGLRESDLKVLVNRSWFKTPKEGNDIKPEWEDLRFASLRRWFKPFITEYGFEKKWNISHSVVKKTIVDKMDNKLFREYHYNVIKYLNRVIFNEQRHYADSFFRNETYYHLYQMNNRSMGIKEFAMIEKGSAGKWIEFITEKMEDADFYDWFLSLFEFMAIEAKEPAEERESLLFYYSNDIILEDIFKALYNKGKYKITEKLVCDLERKIIQFNSLFTLESYDFLTVLIDIRKAVLNAVSGASAKYNEIGDGEISGNSTVRKIAGFYKLLLNAVKQHAPEEAEIIFDKAGKLLELIEKETNASDIKEYRQVYLEYRGDFFFSFLQDNPNARKDYLPEIEHCYSEFLAISEELYRINSGDPDFRARYGRSLQRTGHLLEKFYPEDDEYVTEKILNLYIEENHIFKSLRDFYPQILSFRRDYANSANDLARIYERMNNIDESTQNHLSGIDVYKSILSDEGYVQKDLYMLCLAYENYARFCYRQSFFRKCMNTCRILLLIIEENFHSAQPFEKLKEVKTRTVNLLRLSISGQ